MTAPAGAPPGGRPYRVGVVAACAPGAASRDAFGARWGVAAGSRYADYEAMLAREDLGLVSVCTHAALHAPVAIAAAAAGVRGVLCENAVATSLAEADAVLAACARHGTANREPESSGRDGRAALEIALAGHATRARGGARVALPLADRALRVESR